MRHISRRLVLTSFATLMVIAALAALVTAGDSAAESGKRVALSGYDPVSYFTEDRPEKGSAEFSADFDDTTYRFKSAEHRAMFVADPERYAPQYDGYCAITVSRGAKAEPDPEAWAIADGKLFVFMSKRGVPLFQQQTASILSKANETWRTLRKAPAVGADQSDM
jgi:hypothetical protein